jgi:hypothetical protein
MVLAPIPIKVFFWLVGWLVLIMELVVAVEGDESSQDKFGL